MWSIIFASPYFTPVRTYSMCGARDMFSMPPATTSALSPALIDCAAVITAWSPEPQTLFTVCALSVSGRPAFSPACRAGFWPRPAWRTQPMRHSSM